MNIPESFSRARLHRKRPSGFSLIEMLIVIAIMSILLTVGAVGIGGITSGKSVASAVASTEALFEEARSIAVSKGTDAYVLVCVDDPSNANTYLRRIVVAYKELNPDGTKSENFALSSKGLTLPDQTYFSQSFSFSDQKAGSGTLPEILLQAGNTVKPTYAGRYLAYQFNSEGICTTPGASFVVGTGARGLTDQNPRATGGAKRDFGGFVIWRNGRTSLFRSPDQMNIPPSVTTF